MAKKIHFQDNLYQIARTIDILHEGLKLDLDTEFFTEYYLNQILFIDNINNEIYNFLDENKQLIERKVQIRNLYSVEKKFVDFLDEVIKDSNILDTLPQAEKKINQILAVNKERLDKLEDTVKTSKDETDVQAVVSFEEMEELLNF